MFANLLAFIMIGSTPYTLTVTDLPYDVCVEIVADHIEANAPLPITPREGPLAGQEILVNPMATTCQAYNKV